MDQSQVTVPADETYSLISNEKVEGSTVENAQQEKLGTIKNLMIDKRSGRVEYAVLSFGGFLGIGARYHALPWALLTYDIGRDAYIVNLSKDALKNAPTYDDAQLSTWRDSSFTRDNDDYYRDPPYGTDATF